MTALHPVAEGFVAQGQEEGGRAVTERPFVRADLLDPMPAPAGAGGDHRRVGRAIAAGVLAVLVALYAWNTDRETFARYAPELWDGLLVTMQLVAVSVALGFLLALPLAAARRSRNPLVGAPAYGYSYFFRGTPLLAQVFLLYYGAGEFRGALEAVGLWWMFRDAFTCALLVFTLNTAAYQCEIIRGAVGAVGRGQWEAASALGLRRGRTLRHVVLPQAAITALRPLGNEIVFVVKGSAIASIITVYDLMGETRLAFSRTYDFQVYIWAAVLYLVVVEALRRVWDVMERRLTAHQAR